MSPSPRVSDPRDATELLAAATYGDPSAWEELVRRYGRLVRATVASFRLQEADAVDVVQTTWLRLLGNCADIRDPYRLGGWLATTARREARSLIRRRAAEVAGDRIGEELADRAPTPEDHLIAAESRAAVRTVVDELTGRSRLLAHALFYQPPCSYADISQQTGMPVGSIGPTRQRMLRDLHRKLHQQDHDSDRRVNHALRGQQADGTALRSPPRG